MLCLIKSKILPKIGGFMKLLLQITTLIAISAISSITLKAVEHEGKEFPPCKRYNPICRPL